MTFAGPNRLVSTCAREIVRGEFFEETGVEVPGVVDEYVDAAEPFDGGGYGSVRVLGTGDVEFDHEQLIRLADRFGDGVRVAAGGDDGGVPGGECRLDDVNAHATAGTSYEPDILVSHGVPNAVHETKACAVERSHSATGAARTATRRTRSSRRPDRLHRVSGFCGVPARLRAGNLGPRPSQKHGGASRRMG